MEMFVEWVFFALWIVKVTSVATISNIFNDFIFCLQNICKFLQIVTEVLSEIAGMQLCQKFPPSHVYFWDLAQLMNSNKKQHDLCEIHSFFICDIFVE